MTWPHPLRWLAGIALLACAFSALAFVNFEEAPIRYSETAAENSITRLQERIDAAEVELNFDEQHGFLPDLLRELDIPSTSQTLVFAKTSRQRPLIDPQHPRALYFNDEVYVGQVPGGFLEVAVADPSLGIVFYSLDHRENPEPTFVRETDRCLTCHAQYRTRNVPGLRLDSVFVDSSGEPVISGGVKGMSHKTPFEERWGGWYVQGTHGEMWHRGNQTYSSEGRPQAIRREDAQNLEALDKLVDVSPFLEPTSDLVALMVLAHQADGHNYLIAASFAARKALYDLGVQDEQAPLSDEERALVIPKIQRAGEKLLKYFFFSGEAELASPVRGPSTFAEEFAKRGPHDSKGRTLRELDLKTRLLKYPLSYLIYSEQFTAMPAVMRHYFFSRVGEVLRGDDPNPAFAHLSEADRRAIAEILRETSPDAVDIMTP